jgi:hypothetical protein
LASSSVALGFVGKRSRRNAALVGAFGVVAIARSPSGS